MTIHKSKGLEFDTVILVGLEDGAFFSNNREDLCTFFVALSRAKDRVLITNCQKRDGRNQFMIKTKRIYDILRRASVKVVES